MSTAPRPGVLPTKLTHRQLHWLVACAVLLLGCNGRPAMVVSDAAPDTPAPNCHYPLSGENVDLLFVIDNSRSTLRYQKNVTANFPKLLEALRSERLVGLIPNLHIGVVSTDLGAHPDLPGPCGSAGGDQGRLQNAPRAAGCKAPTDPWISYLEGRTNIPGCGASSFAESLACVQASFSCIAKLGVTGCGFEMPLEAARRALDPEAQINPGFLRSDALLVVVFVTEEDDCSARDARLFSPKDTAMDSPLGPLTSFRCFEFGVRCDINDRGRTGPRRDCQPDYDSLYGVDEYVTFFRKLKPWKDRVIMAGIVGPAGRVEVKHAYDGTAYLANSCQRGDTFAQPAIRLSKFIRAFDGQISPICDDDFGPAMTALGKKIAASVGGRCMR